MKKYTSALFMAFIILTMSLAACSNPSKAVISETQTTYSELVDLHNEVVALYSEVDPSDKFGYAASINEYADLLNTIGRVTIDETTDEELNILITEMDTAVYELEKAKTVLAAAKATPTTAP